MHLLNCIPIWWIVLICVRFAAANPIFLEAREDQVVPPSNETVDLALLASDFEVSGDLTNGSPSPNPVPVKDLIINAKIKEGGKRLSTKYDTWIAFVRCLADYSKNSLEQAIAAAGCQRSDWVAFSMIGNRRPQGEPLRMKHFMFSLWALIEWMERERVAPYYVETNWATVLSGVPLGVGKVFAKDDAVKKEPGEGEASTATAKRDAPAEEPPRGNEPNVTLDSTTGESVFALDIPSNVKVLKNDRVELRVTYFDTPTGAICSAYEFYLGLMSMIVALSDYGPDDPLISQRTYNKRAQWTLIVSATSTAAGQEGTFKMSMALDGLEALAVLMSRETIDKQFNAFSAVIKINGPIVGKIIAFKGTRPPPQATVGEIPETA